MIQDTPHAGVDERRTVDGKVEYKCPAQTNGGGNSSPYAHRLQTHSSPRQIARHKSTEGESIQVSKIKLSVSKGISIAN